VLAEVGYIYLSQGDVTDTLQCTHFSIYIAVYTLQYTHCSIHIPVYTLQYTHCSIYIAVYTLQYTHCSIHIPSYSSLLNVLLLHSLTVQDSVCCFISQ